MPKKSETKKATATKEAPAKEATGEVVETADNKNIIKMARKLVQASSMRLQLEKIEKECKDGILAEMEAKKLTSFEAKVTMNGRPVTLKGDLTKSTSTVVDVEKLTTLITDEQFKQCAKVSLKDAKEILPSALIDKCSSSKEGNAVLKLKTEGNLVVPEIQFY